MVTRVKNEDDMKKKELAKQAAEVVSHDIEKNKLLTYFCGCILIVSLTMKFLFTFFTITTSYNRQCEQLSV